MSAFIGAMAALHADPNMGTAAAFHRPPGTWTAVRLLMSSPSADVAGFGAPGGRAGALEATILAADCGARTPSRGDEVRIDGLIRHVEAAQPDALGITWRLTLSDILSVSVPDPIIGAIRYDAWDAPASALTQAEQAALSPASYHARAPFWASVTTSVSLPAATQQRIDAEIAAAVTAGLAFWAFLGWDPSDPWNAALNLYRTSTRRAEIGFCMIENMQGLYYLGTWLPNVARTIGLMGESGYQRVLGNRPLLLINAMSDTDIIARFGSLDVTTTVIAGIRTQAAAAGEGDPYIVMLDGWSQRAARLADYGADAASAYAALGSITAPTPYASLAAAADQWRLDAASRGVDVVPPLSAGWDYRPRVATPSSVFGEEANGNPNAFYTATTPAELAAHVADGIAWMRANEDAAPAQTALLYAWNEFTEGGFICPTWVVGQPAGDTSRIAALASVLKA